MPESVNEGFALSLVRRHLSGTRDYPLHEDGQRCLARHLAKCSVSIAHATAILESFRHICPTPQEIHDIAWGDKRKDFLPPAPPLTKQWEAQGYTLDAGYYDRMQQELRQKMRKPGEPREIDLMYKAVKDKLKIKDWTHVPWGRIWSTARELGFPLNTEQKEDAARWEATQPRREERQPEEQRKVGNGGPAAPRVITQTDIDDARRKRAADAKGASDGREPGDD